MEHFLDLARISRHLLPECFGLVLTLIIYITFFSCTVSFGVLLAKLLKDYWEDRKHER